MDMEVQKEKIGYRDVLKQKEYLKIIFANLISRFGDSLDAIAFTWLVYAVTGSAAWSAVIFAVNQLPSVLIQPFAGALVEGMNKKKLMVVTDMIRGLITAGLAVIYLTGNVNAWILLAFTIINSTVEAFRIPASMAVIPKILEERYFSYGTSLNATLSTVVQLVGMGAAGLIIGILGIGTAIFADAISFFASASILCFLRIKEKNLQREALHVKKYLSTLKEGIVYLKKQEVIRNFCIMAVLINAAIVPLNSLQSPLIMEVMGQGSELLSVFSVTVTAGMGLGSFIYPFISKRMKVRMQIVSMGLLIALGTGMYTLGNVIRPFVAGIYILTIVISFIIGSAASIFMSVLNVQFMTVVDPNYLARVGSIFNAGACAATPVMSVMVGAATSILSVSQIFVVSAVLCGIIFLYIGIFKVRFE